MSSYLCEKRFCCVDASKHYPSNYVSDKLKCWNPFTWNYGILKFSYIISFTLLLFRTLGVTFNRAKYFAWKPRSESARSKSVFDDATLHFHQNACKTYLHFIDSSVTVTSGNCRVMIRCRQQLYTFFIKKSLEINEVNKFAR